MSQAIALLLENSLRSGVFVLAVLLLRAVLHRLPKRYTSLLWWVVWLRFALPFAVRSRFSMLPLWSPFEQSALTSQPGQATINAQTGKAADWLLIIWAAGLSMILLFGVIRILLLRRKVREAIPLRGRLWLCDWVETPFLLGFFRPRIFLPSGVNEADIPYIEAHEEAHLRHGDPFRMLAAFLLTAVYWFHPLCWVAYFLFRRDLEFACDERTCREYDTDRRNAYVGALMRAAKQDRTVWTGSLSFVAAPMKKRVFAVLHPSKCKRKPLLLAAAFCVGILLCLTVEPSQAETAAVPAHEPEAGPTATPPADQPKATEPMNPTPKPEIVLGDGDTLHLVSDDTVFHLSNGATGSSE